MPRLELFQWPLPYSSIRKTSHPYNSSKSIYEEKATILPKFIILHLVGGWTNPFDKHDVIKLDHFPTGKGENKKALKVHHLVIYIYIYRSYPPTKSNQKKVNSPNLGPDKILNYEFHNPIDVNSGDQETFYPESIDFHPNKCSSQSLL